MLTEMAMVIVMMASIVSFSIGFGMGCSCRGASPPPEPAKPQKLSVKATTYACVNRVGIVVSDFSDRDSALRTARKAVTPARPHIIMKLEPYEAVEIPITVTRLD